MYLTALAAFAVFAAPAAADADRPVCDGGVLTARPGAPLTTEFPRCEGAGENPTITATPSIGTVTGVPFVYTPPAGFVGVDHFTYTVTNTATNETSLPATVSVVVNTPATCADAELTTPLDTPLRIPWKAFPCTDPDGQSLLIHADDNAANGDVDDDFGTGTVTYTPNPGFTGTDEFTFHASDGVRDTPERTITVKVTPPVQADPSPTPAATVSPTPTPAGGGGAPAADTTAPSVAVKATGKATLAHGVTLTLTSDEAVTTKATLTVDKATARKYKLDKRAKGPVTVGTATAAASGKITIRLSAKARRAFKKAKRVKLTVTVVAADGAGNRTTKTLRVTLGG